MFRKIGVVTYEDADLEFATLSVSDMCFAVKFVKYLKTASCRTTENGFFWETNILKIENSL